MKRIRYPHKTQKETTGNLVTALCNKACQSLCMSTKETPLKSSCAEHQRDVKRVILSQKKSWQKDARNLLAD